ncbi:sulfurtransferase [Pararhodobacter sp. CCB-MM2]|uniref:sulfurtransferase n=1 Tax=Pararhodobacter sp. CCB-MM2 TaxID=1786003 RepID=UPI000830EA8F|nr:sulfurtransferase [Pararhodobacter sp. CCB-MM2]
MVTDPLIDPSWLAERLDHVVVLDATYGLGAAPEQARAAVVEARIPGARHFDIDAISAPGTELPHMLPDGDTFARAMAALGIDGTRPVVVYDRSLNHFSAPRVWFTLTLFGLENVHVLDGGLARWRAEGHAVASGPVEVTPVAPRDWPFDAARVLTGTALAEALRQGTAQVVDARAQDRFDGRAPEPRAGLKSGAMPGAVCRPFATLTGPDGRFATPETLRDMFAEVGPEPVLSCGSGVTACVLALGLARIGRRARLYDGSWTEWGQGKLGPIVTATP